MMRRENDEPLAEASFSDTFKVYSKDRSLLSIFKDDLNLNIHSELDVMSYEVLNHQLKGIQVSLFLPNGFNSQKVYDVRGLYPSPEKHSFVVSAEKSIFHTVRTYNVVQYYKFERKYDLQYPHLPCVRAGSKELAIPIELCTVITKEINFKGRRFDSMSGNGRENINSGQHPAINEFDASNDDQSLFLPISYFEEQSTPTSEQKTNDYSEFNAQKKTVLPDNEVFSNWAILNLDKNTDLKHLKSFEAALITTAKEMDLAVIHARQIYNCPLENESYQYSTQETIVKLFSMLTNEQLCLVMVVAPTESHEMYDIIKEMFKMNVGGCSKIIKNTILKTSMDNTIMSKIWLETIHKLAEFKKKMSR